jgi:hypothetical protein
MSVKHTRSADVRQAPQLIRIFSCRVVHGQKMAKSQVPADLGKLFDFSNQYQINSRLML